jgi:aminoglycoside phosphotransferase (APT) family kinase protein
MPTKLKGENATLDRFAEPRQAAIDLAQFITALQRIDPTGGPPPGEHNFGRGVPLAERDPSVRAAIASLDTMLDADAVIAAWEAVLHAPASQGPPVWIHGDLSPGNLLVVQGRLSGVIDFGGLGVGDPACDLIAAWNLFSAETRDVFRSALLVDDATWARATIEVVSSAPPANFTVIDRSHGFLWGPFISPWVPVGVRTPAMPSYAIVPKSLP